MTAAVAERLFREPWEFEFFEAVRLLEILYPDRSPVGEDADPQREIVRLKSLISFVFAPSEIRDLAPETADSPATLTVNLFSVGGAAGPLPDADSDRVIEQNFRRNPAFAEFLDLFHHRLLSLLVRTRKLHYPSYTSGSPHGGAAADYLYSSFGLGWPRLRARVPRAERALLFYSGILAQHPRSASGLERMLADYFQTPARVIQLQGQWRRIDAGQWTSIGVTGRNRRLGDSATLGTRIWDQQARFEVVLGPMNLALFHDLLPLGAGYAAACELTRFYAGPELEFQFRLTLRAADIPESRLGSARLGWTSWLKTRPAARDDSQVLLLSRRPADPFAGLEARPVTAS